MGIVNRRNAVVGWSVWQLGKRVAKRKAKKLVPGTVDNSKQPNTPAIVSILGLIGGALFFWRKRGPESPDTSE